jgi:hypothetical protein
MGADMVLNVVSVQGIIDRGALVCSRIKELYYQDRPWKECYRDVARIFTVLKSRVRVYGTFPDEDAMVRFLSEIPDEDLIDIYDNNGNDSEKTSTVDAD